MRIVTLVICTEIYLKLIMNLEGLRMKYKDNCNVFVEDLIEIKEPIDLFHKWFQEVLQNQDILEPNAMCLSTCSKNGIPSARFVLCKEYNENGFKFFTNLESRKAKELEENPNAALTFYWAALNRQIRIEGIVEKVPINESLTYFSSRPKASQISAAASRQSSVVPNRDYLVKLANELQNQFHDKQIPKPDFWGGYILKPTVIEFWQGQTNRLHDRIRFRKKKSQDIVDNVLLHQGEKNWVYERLSP